MIRTRASLVGLMAVAVAAGAGLPQAPRVAVDSLYHPNTLREKRECGGKFSYPSQKKRRKQARRVR